MADKKKGGAPAQTPKGAPQQRGDSARGPRRDNRSGYNSIQIDPAVTGLKPVPRPNREQFEADINSHNQTIDRLKKEISETTNKINDANKQKGDLFQQKDKLFNQLKELKVAKTQSKENRKKYIDEIKALGEQKQKMREELQKLKEKIPSKLRGEPSKEFVLKDVLDRIELKITELENKLKLTSMPLSEEKTVVAKISSLHNAKKLAREYDQEMQKVKGTLDSNNRPTQDKRERLNGLIQQEDKVVAELKARQDVLQKELDTVREKITKITEALPALLKKREDLRAQVGTEQAAKNEIFKKREEQQKVYGEYMEKVREIKKEEWNKQKVVIAAEREKRKVEQLQQQLTSVQFEEELHTCDVLVAHLQQYLLKPEEDEEASEQAASAPATTTPEGAVVLKRDVSEDVADAYKGGKRKQKAQKPKAPVLKADSVLKHSLTLLQQFESLSLACPLKVADVPKSIEEIKQKKEHFILLGIEKKKQLEAEWLAKQKEAEAKAEAEANAEDADAEADPEAQS